MAGPGWRGRRAAISAIVLVLAFVVADTTAQGAAGRDDGLPQLPGVGLDAPSSGQAPAVIVTPTLVQSPNRARIATNCSSFATWSDAQAFYIANGGPAQDPFGLDGDHDGIACESLPGAPGNPATATARAVKPTGSPPTATSVPASPTPIATISPSPTADQPLTPTLMATLTASPIPAPPAPPGSNRFEDNSSAVAYVSAASWTQLLNGSASAGHYRRATVVGSSATFTTNNDGPVQVSWGGVRGPAGGNADVALDGIFVTTVSLYAPSPTFGPVATFPVPSGRHALRVTVRGDHEPSAIGSEVTVDYFDVILAIGGKGFTLQRLGPSNGVQTTWTTGVAQSGYWVGRLSASGLSVLPIGGTPLPVTTTTFTDSGLLTDPEYCYELFPIQDSPTNVIGKSDALCMLTGVRSGVAPSSFSLRLDESNIATLAWTPSQFAFGADYQLMILNDSGLHAVDVPVGQLTMTDDTGGQYSCYAVVARLDGSQIGNTDALCGFPGLAVL